MNEEDKKFNPIVEWQLGYVTSHAISLRPADLEWAIKMEEAYKKQGFLSDKQREVVEDIYKRY